MTLIVQGKSSFILWSTLINIISQTSKMSVSYKMKHAKQQAWTIEQKIGDGSKSVAKSYLCCSVLVSIFIIGLVSVTAVTSTSTNSDYKSNHKERKNFLNQPHWKY